MLNADERKGGRPALEPGRKSQTIPVRFGPSAHDRIIQLAAQRGMKVTEYIRRRALDEEDDE